MTAKALPANYYGNVNPTLLDVVDPAARRICELGCGSGALARAIRRRCPGIYYVGVEMAADELVRARDALDIALLRDLDATSDWAADTELSAAMPENSLDHVIFGDVLEHLREPQIAVQQAAKRLVPGGSVLACIPNVQHWSVFVHLMRGTWPRHNQGLFDRTHIRWFTLTDMVTLLEQAGLVVERVLSRNISPARGEPVIECLKPLAEALGVNHTTFKTRSLPVQYVLVARKPLAAQP